VKKLRVTKRKRRNKPTENLTALATTIDREAASQRKTNLAQKVEENSSHGLGSHPLLIQCQPLNQVTANGFEDM